MPDGTEHHGGYQGTAQGFRVWAEHLKQCYLQVSGAAPAVDVTFAVALPAASRNSLLVVQSASPVVRAQFSGWFVYAMGGQGYDVNAEITSISAQVQSCTNLQSIAILIYRDEMIAKS